VKPTSVNTLLESGVVGGFFLKKLNIWDPLKPSNHRKKARGLAN